MTNRPPQSRDDDDRNGGDVIPHRPIPDGGLGSAMPDWLRQTPSWKRTPEPAPIRTIPAPDTSIIDPRRLIDVDDLPQWLQAVSARRAETRPETPTPPAGDAAGAVDVTPSPTIDVPEHTARETLDVPPDRAAPASESRSRSERPAHIQLKPSPSRPPRPWWMSDAAVASLFIAIILTLAYVVLEASGVI